MTIRIAVNGYGVIGKRQDAVRAMPDMELVGGGRRDGLASCAAVDLALACSRQWRTPPAR